MAVLVKIVRWVEDAMGAEPLAQNRQYALPSPDLR